MNQLELFLNGIKIREAEDISGTLPRHATKKHDIRDLSAIKRIVLHTTDWDTTPKRIAEYDIAKNHISDTGCPGITYHEIVMKDGKCYLTLPWNEISWQCGPWNEGSLAVSLMYRVSNDKDVDTFAPTEEAIKAAVSRCGEICLSLGLTPDCVFGHRELQFTGWFWSKGSKVRRKTCPGMQIDLDLFRTRVAAYMQTRMATKGLYDGEIDGDFGPASKAAQAQWKE
jgi:hypothetical protein